jgi:ferredoxin
MRAVRIVVDRDECAQMGECTLAAPDAFSLATGELVYDATPDEAERAAVEEAVAACPMQAISLTDE